MDLNLILHMGILVASLALVIKGATLATTYSSRLAENFQLSKYVVGFIIVAFISILPETLISISATIEGVPSFGLGTLLGSNIADLTLIFAVLIIYAGRGLKIESKILKNIRTYPLFLLFPLALGLNGHYSRLDGIFLILIGFFFYYTVFKNGVDESIFLNNQENKLRRFIRVFRQGSHKLKNFLLLLFSMTLLLIGSHFTVTSATELAHELAVTPILIGMLVVSLGTTMPELFFSIKAIKKKDDGLAIGDILGSVLADATIVVGLIACISPFNFPAKIIYVTGVFMLAASLVLLKFMHSGKTISRKEGYLLLAFWLCYVIVEFSMNK